MSSGNESTRKLRSDFTKAELDDLSTDDFITLGHKGWLEIHPEEQEHIHLEIKGETVYDGNLFRELDPEEEASFRQHARETYEIGMPIEELFHPVWKDEARKMNKEIADAASSHQ